MQSNAAAAHGHVSTSLHLGSARCLDAGGLVQVLRMGILNKSLGDNDAGPVGHSEPQP